MWLKYPLGFANRSCAIPENSYKEHPTLIKEFFRVILPGCSSDTGDGLTAQELNIPESRFLYVHVRGFTRARRHMSRRKMLARTRVFTVGNQKLKLRVG